MRTALAASGLCHGVTNVCALAAALSLASSAPATPLPEPVHVGELFTVVRLFDALAGSPLRHGLLPGVLLLAAAPLLRVLWLRAQLTAAPLPVHARAAAAVYRQALAVHALGLAYAALLLGLALLVARGLGAALAGYHDERLAQCSGLLAAAPLVLAALSHAPSVADRAQLELARGSDRLWPALRQGLTHVGARECGLRAVCELSVAGLGLAALLPRLWLGSQALVALLLTSQLCALGQTAVRAAWLAWLSERAERAAVGPGAADLSPTPGSESPAPRAAGSTTPTR
jgi:hypothetical protein